MFFVRKYPVLETESLILRLPEIRDHVEWANLRRSSAEFLDPWEPVRKLDYLSKRAFKTRVAWSRIAVKDRRALPLLLVRKKDETVLGGLTLDNIQGGVSKACTVGYWMGEQYSRRGYMAEALQASVNYAFQTLDLSRVQAGCLPENEPSRALLEKSGFKYEGVAQSYLQIAGRWRNHVLYANLRSDRRGRTDAI